MGNWVYVGSIHGISKSNPNKDVDPGPNIPHGLFDLDLTPRDSDLIRLQFGPDFRVTQIPIHLQPTTKGLKSRMIRFKI